MKRKTRSRSAACERDRVRLRFGAVLRPGKSVRLRKVPVPNPGKRAYDVDVDAVGAPFGGGDAGQAADALLGGGIGALAVVAEQAGAGCEVDPEPRVSLRCG